MNTSYYKIKPVKKWRRELHEIIFESDTTAGKVFDDRYVQESSILVNALRASRPKITVFLLTIVTISITTGSVMYLIEGPKNGFSSIPVAMYWTIVTLTTVGYGDISPQTVQGQIIATILMIMAYGILAVPTGIITYELSKASNKKVSGHSIR